MPARRNKRRSNMAQGPVRGPALDPSPYRYSARDTPLDHTADVSEFDHSTPPLMRTVPGDRLPGSRHSPTVRSRASIRSRPVSPWEQVRLISPQLTDRAIVCAKRSIRREVLFAIKGTGKGARSKKTYTANSKKRC